MKIQNALVSNILDRSQRYFAHVTTVTLLWRVQNIVVIDRAYFTLECFEFSSNFVFDRNMLSGTGARHRQNTIDPRCAAAQPLETKANIPSSLEIKRHFYLPGRKPHTAATKYFLSMPQAAQIPGHHVHVDIWLYNLYSHPGWCAARGRDRIGPETIKPPTRRYAICHSPGITGTFGVCRAWGQLWSQCSRSELSPTVYAVRDHCHPGLRSVH